MEAGVASRCMAVWVLWPLGYPDQALEKIREALTLAREVAHPYSLAYALMFASAVHTWRGEAQAALELADAVIALSREQGFPSWVAVGIFSRGYALAAQGEEKKGIAQMLEGSAAYRAVGAQSSSDRVSLRLARGVSEERVRRTRRRRSWPRRWSLSRTPDERHYEAGLYRLKGELMRMRDSDVEAEQSFRTAIRIAQSQSAKSFELRATTSLARLLASNGRRDEARAMLAEIYGWFTEGFDTADLKDAKALLDELSG